MKILRESKSAGVWASRVRAMILPSPEGDTTLAHGAATFTHTSTLGYDRAVDVVKGEGATSRGSHTSSSLMCKALGLQGRTPESHPASRGKKAGGSEVLRGSQKVQKSYPAPGYYVMMNPYSLNSNGNGQDLRRFLEQVGTDPKEARYWLKQFQHVSTSDSCKAFAVVQVEQDVFLNPDMLDSLGSCLSFLQRHGMKCVVIHGGQSLPEGTEVTPHRLQRIRSKINSDSMMLVSILESHGAPARPLFMGSGILHAESDQRGGLHGVMNRVNLDPIQWAMQSGHIPVIQGVGESSCGQLLDLHLDHVTASVSRCIQPLKVMFVNTQGGYRRESGEVIGNINLPDDVENEDGFCQRPWCTPPLRKQIDFIDSLLNTLPIQSSVVITSATSLLTELFTHHGSGTFFKITEPLLAYTSLEDVDLDRLRTLMNRSFGKDLSGDYFDSLDGKLHKLYLSENYNAAAVVTLEEGTCVPYLDKFAVGVAKQSEGMGVTLWDSLCRDFKQLFWRSSGTNTINPWYFKRCDGSWNAGDWTVFWYGAISHKESSELIDLALDMPHSFLSNGAEAEVVAAK